MKPSYEELEQMLEESQREFRSADITMRNLEAKCAALAAENAGLKEDRDTLARYWIEDGGDEDCAMSYCEPTPATDAFLAEVRASALNDLCAAFVKHKELAGLDDSQEVTVFEATDALFHCAEQLDTQLRKGVQS